MKLGPSGRSTLAGVVWVAVGVMLIVRGYPFFGMIESMTTQIASVIGALVVGGAKGWFVLRKTSKRNLARIHAMEGPQWFWTIYPAYLAVAIPFMIGFGVALRLYVGPTYPWTVVVVYFGIGAALIVSSLPYFQGASALPPSQGGADEADAEKAAEAQVSPSS